MKRLAFIARRRLVGRDLDPSPGIELQRSVVPRIISGLLALAVLLAVIGLPARQIVQAEPEIPAGLEIPAAPVFQGSGDEVIAMVNALRAANGLPAYTINGALMAAAQAHSEYQAANQDTSHTGADGSTPKERDIAAGYGGGAVVFISENIVSGVKMSPATAVQIWQGDSLHLNTMLSPNYTDAGAGVASDGRVTYITLDVGYIAGEAGSAPSPPAAASQAPTAKPPKGFVIVPVATVTPQPDGSILHIVQLGEVLFNIALAYNVKLSDLYKLNYLNDKSVIFPGQKLKIKAPVPTATPTETPTPTRIPTATRRPTRTPMSKNSAELTPTIDPIPLAASATISAAAAPAGRGTDPLLVAIGVLIIVGLSLVIAGNLLKRK